MIKLKKNIGILLNQTEKLVPLKNILVRINLIIFHWNEREHKIYKKNFSTNRKLYIIRSRGKTEGLLSTVFFVMQEIYWAIENKYIPFVDFNDSNCQYHENRIINNTNNAWEYYFLQPSKLNYQDVMINKCNLLSGWTLYKKKRKIYMLDSSIIHFQPYIYEIVEKIKRKQFANQSILGVFIRGTDYVSLKPKNHPIQPSIDEVIKKIKEFYNKYNVEKIYVVTEDFSYYERIKSEFKNVFSFGDNFVKNYKQGNYVSEEFNNSPYERGLNYLIRILLLSYCNYTVCSQASGSNFLKLIRKNKPIDEYWFNLGNY